MQRMLKGDLRSGDIGALPATATGPSQPLGKVGGEDPIESVPTNRQLERGERAAKLEQAGLSGLL